MDGHSIAILEYDRILARLAAAAALEENRPRLRAPAFPGDDELGRQFDLTEDARHLLSLQGKPELPPLPPLLPLLEEAAKEGSVLAAADLRVVACWLQGGAHCSSWLAHPDAGGLAPLAGDCRPASTLYRTLLIAISEEGELNDAEFPALREIRAEILGTQQALQRSLSELINSPESGELFQERLVTVRDGRYVIPLKAGKKGKVPGIIHSRSQSGETYFLEPLPAVEKNNRITTLLLDEQAEIHRILREFTARLRGEVPACRRMHAALLELDRFTALALLGHSLKAVRPRFAPFLDLVQARHPLLEVTPVPVDIRLDGHRMMLITGPNTGGKTVTLKTAGLLTMMANGGLMIPAAEESAVPRIRELLCDIGDEQSIQGNLSTFSGHIKNIKHLLQQAQPDTLVLIDEPGAGTDPAEGAPLARAILETLLESGATVLASTHYHELKFFAFRDPRILSASVALDPLTMAPLYTIKSGEPGASRALDTARRLGLPEQVLARAESLIPVETRNLEKALTNLQEELARVRNQHEEAERIRGELETLAASYRMKLDKLHSERDRILGEARDRAAETLRELTRQGEAMLRELKERGAAPNARELSAWKNSLGELGATTLAGLPEPETALPPEKELPGAIAVGDRVLVRGLGKRGEVLSLASRGRKALVRIGGTVTSVAAEELTRLEKPAAPRTRPRTRIEADVSAFSPTLDLRGIRYEDALEKIRLFIDQAALAGCLRVTVIHGKGTGALQQAAREALANHPLVNDFFYSPLDAGGSGSTIVVLAGS